MERRCISNLGQLKALNLIKLVENQSDFVDKTELERRVVKRFVEILPLEVRTVENPGLLSCLGLKSKYKSEQIYKMLTEEDIYNIISTNHLVILGKDIKEAVEEFKEIWIRHFTCRPHYDLAIHEQTNGKGEKRYQPYFMYTECPSDGGIAG